MKKLLLKYRKSKIKKILYNEKIENACIIYNLLNNNTLDYLIKSLLKGKVRTNKKFNNGNCYLNKEKQFITLLNQFITFAKWQFYFLDNVKFNSILEKFISSKYSNVLLLKHAWGSNEYIDEYNLNFKKIMISNFVFNLKYCKNIFEDILKEEKIDIDLTNLDNIKEKDIDKILNILREIFYTSFFKFEIYELVDPIDKDVEYIYKLHYTKLLNNYKNNYDMLESLIKYE
ncbi:MAG: hypothetical protein IJO32_02310 [Bacilli bacterium]|nr:hypothetical protein [Bacilli bacterium]